MTTERADVFAALAELAERYPHWRVGQLIANAAGWADSAVWDVEDEELLTAVREHFGVSAGRNGIGSAGMAVEAPLGR